MTQFSWRRVVYGLVVAGTAILFPRLASAQTGRITGVVTDAANGQPVEGVQVLVQGTGYGALTQANGRYFILSVPPGTYTVVARRIGFAQVEVSNVEVRIDAAREVNFQLQASTTTLTTQRIVAPAAPLVERGVAASGGAITTEVIQALPVTSVAGVLQLQQGFLSVPQNTNIIAFTESRRNPVSGIRIRGGRGGSTQTLIDGIPINNVIFGDRAMDVNNFAISQIDFLKGGMEPQYGNAIAGIVNIATLEGGTNVAGNIEYQNTGLAGALGSEADEVFGYDLFRGSVSGPVPGTADKVRFAVAGSFESGADQVAEFDDQTFSFTRFDNGPLPPDQDDIFGGWRALGFNQTRDIFGKLTFLPTQQSKINLMVIDYQRQRQPYDQDYTLVGFDPLRYRGHNTILDSLGYLQIRGLRDVAQASIIADRRLYGATFEQRFSRTTFRLRGARFDQERNTCNYFQGTCQAAAFSPRGFNNRFVAARNTPGSPTWGTDEFYGGEDVTTYVGRADVESQVTDHHNLLGGVFFQRHNIVYNEIQNLGGNNSILPVPTYYEATPYELAAYFQDRIEYDFLTVRLGGRFDYAKASGQAFRNPQVPSNGTTAAEVCNGTAPSLGATTPYTYTDPVSGQTFTGLDACLNQPAGPSGRSELFEQAIGAAQADDFEEAKARVAFSPRIQIAFPLSERSQFFANAGRYVQNPLYNNLYQNTGIGTTAGAAQGICTATEVKPGTTECAPIVANEGFTPSFLGNPSLLLEQATTAEIGYAAEFAQNYAVNVIMFNRDETGLSGIRRSRPVFDVGTTYGGQSLPDYNVIVNQDYSTTRGIEVQFRRRLTNLWGYDINYSYSKATTNGPSVELQQEQITQTDSIPLREIRSEIDQPHVFNASVYFQGGAEGAGFRYGGILRNTTLSATLRAASGLPYTPTTNATGFGVQGTGELNSGRAPATSTVDLQLLKEFRVANLRYAGLLRVVNVFDQKNCIQVYETTGRCDAGVVNGQRGGQGNNNGDVFGSTQFDRPEFYGQRRSIFTGVRVSF